MGAIPIDDAERPVDNDEEINVPERPAPEMPRILDFADVIRGLKNGKRFARTGWNGQGMFIEMQKPDSGSKMTLPYAFLVYTKPDNRGGLNIAGVVPWLASQTDMFSNDWTEIIVSQQPAPENVPVEKTVPEGDTEE